MHEGTSFAINEQMWSEVQQHAYKEASQVEMQRRYMHQQQEMQRRDMQRSLAAQQHVEELEMSNLSPEFHDENAPLRSVNY